MCGVCCTRAMSMGLAADRERRSRYGVMSEWVAGVRRARPVDVVDLVPVPVSMCIHVVCCWQQPRAGRAPMRLREWEKPAKEGNKGSLTFAPRGPPLDQQRTDEARPGTGIQ